MSFALSKHRFALFDLDGTLLPMDTDYFLAQYVASVTPHFSHLVEPQLFARQLLQSSHAIMADNHGDKTNLDKFFADFLPKVNRTRAEVEPIFAHFYASAFSELRTYTSPSPLARDLVETALTAGYKVVLATNPLFSRRAVLERMSWANVADLPWSFIASNEDTHYCKPNPAYFGALLERLGAAPEDCIHFGNDLTEDMAARQVGIPVVMVTDYLVNRQHRPCTDVLYHGSLASVTQWFRSYVSGHSGPSGNAGGRSVKQ